jgi:hypothetical protein
LEVHFRGLYDSTCAAAACACGRPAAPACCKRCIKLAAKLAAPELPAGMPRPAPRPPGIPPTPNSPWFILARGTCLGGSAISMKKSTCAKAKDKTHVVRDSGLGAGHWTRTRGVISPPRYHVAGSKRARHPPPAQHTPSEHAKASFLPMHRRRGK